MNDLTGPPAVHRKDFDNGDVAFYTDAGMLDGLHYCSSEGAIYAVQAVPPSQSDPAGQHGVELRRFSLGPANEVCEQSLILAKYPSQMAAEEHAHEVGQTLLDQGLEGLRPEVDRVALMPNEVGQPVYVMGLYPLSPEDDAAALSLIRMDGEQVDVAPIARGAVAEMAEIEQRLLAIQAEGETDVFLKAATAEAVRAKTLAPNTPLFAAEGAEIQADPAHRWFERRLPIAWEDHPDWPDRSVWDEPLPPQLAALVMPVTFDDDLTPFDKQGRYVPHHVDEAHTVHFFSVIDRPADSPLPGETTHELRYYRAQIDDEGVVTHHSQPVMPVDDPATSPWALPALQLHLEEGEVDIAQAFARDIARDFHGLDFPDPDDLPALGQGEPPPAPDTGWYHFDAALVLATPQGVDDGYSVGVVDVYAHHEDAQWAARYLPIGEFDTFDEALAHQQQTLLQRIGADRESAVSPAGFNASPALYKQLAEDGAAAALTDLLEQNDGQLPLDYEEDRVSEWEPLTSKEWAAYRDQLRVVTHAIPGTEPILDHLPTGVPQLAGDELIAASVQPDGPYLQAADFDFEAMFQEVRSPLAVWQLEVVPAQNPDGDLLGYSAVFVNHPASNGPLQSQWLEIGQFETEERAQALKDDFQAVVWTEPFENRIGPDLAELVADEMEMSTEWQPMSAVSLDLLKAGEWTLTHQAADWHPQVDDTQLLVEPETQPGGPTLEL
jgi:hypothetical protein